VGQFSLHLEGQFWLLLYNKVAAELVSITYETSLKFGRKPNAIGKDENHWNLIFKTVALEFLQQKV